MRINRMYLYLLSFLEGGAVMTAEVVGAKLLAPYFGTSLYVWAAALGVTLGGLMLGYFFGGLISSRSVELEKNMYITLIVAGIFLILMPWISQYIMMYNLNMPLALGAVISLLVFLLPPLFCMGMISPLMVGILSKSNVNAGHGAGNVYAISTLGGIIFTFSLGFFIIPRFGILLPAVITGSLLTICSLIGFGVLGPKKYSFLISLVLIVAITLTSFDQPVAHEGVLFEKEGMLGQIKVVEFETEDGNKARALLVNQTLQTVEIINNPEFPFWNYVDYINRLVPEAKQGEKSLLLGVGGGTLFKNLLKKGYQVDGVEFDSEIIEIAKQYFSLPKAGNITIDDARHFVKKAKKQSYDLIIVDVLKGESIPEHVLTKESFIEIKSLLKAHGTLIINFYGYTEHKIGRATRSVIKTLENAGYRVRPYLTPGKPDFRNTILVAQDVNSKRENYSSLESENLYFEDGFVLTDLHPRTNLYVLAAMRWRNLNNQWYNTTFKSNK